MLTQKLATDPGSRQERDSHYLKHSRAAIVAPILKPGEVVIMDNLSAHKPVAIRAQFVTTKSVELRGCGNGIRLSWSILKCGVYGERKCDVSHNI